MEIHLTRAVAFAPVCRYLETNGATVARDLESVGISPEAIASSEALLPLEYCARFVDRTASQYGLGDLGLEAGSAASIGDFGLFGDVLRRALTLQDVIDQFIKWLPMADSGAKAWMEADGATQTVRFWIDHDVGVAKSAVNEYGLMLLIDAVRLALGPVWRPETVWMARPRSKSIECFEALSEAAVQHHPSATGVEIPARLLATPNLPAHSPREAGSVVDEAVLQSSLPADHVELVDQVIRSGIGYRLLSLEEIAEVGGVSTRAVQRRLSASGTSYRELVDRVRFEESIGMLEDGSVPVTEIALRLGYGEIANFTHAFVRWTGLSPTAYREEFLVQK